MKMVLLAALWLSPRLWGWMADPEADRSSGDTGSSPVSGQQVPPHCCSGLGPTGDVGLAQDGAACRGSGPLPPCPPQHPEPCRHGAWEMGSLWAL